MAAGVSRDINYANIRATGGGHEEKCKRVSKLQTPIYTHTRTHTHIYIRINQSAASEK